MATIFAHAIAAATLGYALPLPGIKKDGRFYCAAALCSMIPDADVLGFGIGIQYGDFLGHRGFSHSVVFALLLGIAVTLSFGNNPTQKPGIFLAAFMALATFSHGILDAFTNGGLGVALFSPFYNERMFFPVTPIEVSPIGRRFFSEAGVTVLASEAIWIVLPCTWILLLAFVVRRFWANRAPDAD